MEMAEFIRCLMLPRSVSKEMWEWLNMRPGREFFERQLEDVGIFSRRGSRDVEPQADNTEYTIRRLLFASGNDERFLKHRYHASADDLGGHQSFWPINFYTMKSHQAERTLEQMTEWCMEIDTDLEVHRSPNGKGISVVK